MLLFTDIMIFAIQSKNTMITWHIKRLCARAITDGEKLSTAHRVTFKKGVLANEQ